MEEQPHNYTNRELWMLIDKNNETNELQHQNVRVSIDGFQSDERKLFLGLNYKPLKQMEV